MLLDWLVIGGLAGASVVVSLIGWQTMERDPQRFRGFLFEPYELSGGRNFQGWLLSHFSHADFGHLLWNMLAFVTFALGLVQDAGALPMLLIYVLSGLGADAVVYFLRKDDPDYRALGASGSVSGIVFAAIVFNPGLTLFIFLIPIPIPGPIFAVAYVLISVYLMRGRPAGGMAHEAHLGGAAAGFLLAALLAPGGLGPLFAWATGLFQ